MSPDLPHNFSSNNPCPIEMLVINQAEILDRLDGDREMMVQMIELFETMAPDQLEDIARAIASQDAAQVQLTAHTFKGSVGLFTKEGPYGTAFTLEGCGRTGNLENILPLWEQLQAETHHLVQALTALTV